MRALTVAPGIANSARVDDVARIRRFRTGAVSVWALAIGVCGTDRDIVGGHYGWAPPGQTRLVIGHEFLGIAREAPPGSGEKAGDHVAGGLCAVRIRCHVLRRCRRVGHVP